MNTKEQYRQDRRSEILDRLRMHFGEERTGELGDMDGLGLLTTFLRRMPSGDQGEDFSDELGDDLSPQDLRLILRRRRDKRAAVSERAVGGQDEDAVIAAVDREGEVAAAEAMTFGALIEEIPRLRENFAEWISAVDADYLPGSSTREELERLRDKAEYRLKILKVMVNETQKELEALTLAIRASEATGVS